MSFTRDMKKSFPRTRGDEPQTGVSYTNQSMFSPHARG